MNILWWVTLGFLAYWAALLALGRAGYLPPSVKTQGPLITLHTTRGRAFLDRLSRYRTFWRAWGNLGVGIALVIMVGMFLVVINSAIASMLAPEPTAVAEPRNVLVVPGVNEFLPLSAAPEIVLGLLIGLVVHEGGHGLLCRVEDIEIESMGVALIAIIPIGAFVQPEERSQRRADRGGQSRMFAAGVMNNFVLTVIAFALLFWLVGGFIVPAPGAAVGGTLPGSAAESAGLTAGDRITGIEGTAIENASDLERYLETSAEPIVTTELGDGETVDIERSVLVVEAVRGGPSGLDRGDRVTAVDGQPIYTTGELLDALEDAPVTTVTVDGEREETFPAGAYVALVTEDGPFATAGAPIDEQITPIITSIDGERTATMEALQEVLAGTDPGQTVTVEAFFLEPGETVAPGDEPETLDVTLGPPGEPRLGVALERGMTGVSLYDFGVQLYPSERFLATIGGDTDEPSLFGLDTFFGKTFSAMVLPIAALLGPAIEQNFAGFTGHVTAFYEVQGPLAGAEPLVFLAANILFWAGWINFNLGIFNCIPAFPLDGGHLLRASAESVISRLPLENRYIAVKYVTVSVGVAMLVGLLVMIFGQGMLS